uniref:Protein Gawky n=1 Tax=Parastrongyloides trichosuri TaxID=131310 RepID=A0A0N5A452_PARTI
MWNSGSNSDQPNTGNGFNTGNFSNVNQKSSAWNQGVAGSQNDSLSSQSNAKFNGSGWMKQNVDQGQQINNEFQKTQSGNTHRNGSISNQGSWNIPMNNNWAKNPNVGSYADHVKKNIASGNVNTAYNHRGSQMPRLEMTSTPHYETNQSWNAGKVNQESPWEGVRVNDANVGTWNQNPTNPEYGRSGGVKNQNMMISHWKNKPSSEPNSDMVWQNPESDDYKRHIPDNGTSIWGKPNDYLHIKRWVIKTGDPFFDQVGIESICTEDWSKVELKGIKDGVIGSHFHKAPVDDKNKTSSEGIKQNDRVIPNDWSDEVTESPQQEVNPSENYSKVSSIPTKSDGKIINGESSLDAQLSEINTGTDINTKMTNTGLGQAGGLKIETKDNHRISQPMSNNQSPSETVNDKFNSSPSSLGKSRLHQWKNGTAVRTDLDSIVVNRGVNGMTTDNNTKQILNQQLFDFLPSDVSQAPFDLNNTFPNSANNVAAFGNFMNNSDMANSLANQYPGPSGVPCVPNHPSSQIHSQRTSREVSQTQLINSRTELFNQYRDPAVSEALQRIQNAVVYAQTHKIKDPNSILTLIFTTRETAAIWNSIVSRLSIIMDFNHVFNANVQINYWSIFQRTHICPFWVAVQNIEVPESFVRGLAKIWGEISFFPIRMQHFIVFKFTSPLVHSLRSFRNEMVNRYPTTSLSLITDDNMKLVVDILSQNRNSVAQETQNTPQVLHQQMVHQLQHNLLQPTYSDFMSMMNPINNTGNAMQNISESINFASMPWSTSDGSTSQEANQWPTVSSNENRNMYWLGNQNPNQYQDNDTAFFPNMPWPSFANGSSATPWNPNGSNYGSNHNESAQSSFQNNFNSRNPNHPF